MRYSVLVLLLVVLARPVAAAPITYSFAGAGGLSGSFVLDDAGSWDLHYGGAGMESVEGVLTSPIHSISGVYGDYAFTGTPRLVAFDQPAVTSTGHENLAPDSWIVRSVLTSNTVNSVSLTALNLFIYTNSAATTLGLTPPQGSLQYAFGFSDGSFVVNPLTSIAITTPEPMTGLLLTMGAGLVGWSRRRRR